MRTDDPDFFERLFYGVSPVRCADCRRHASEVGELRVYPPELRVFTATLGPNATLMPMPHYCGPCAVRKAVGHAAAHGATV